MCKFNVLLFLMKQEELKIILEIAYNGPGYARDIRRPLTVVQFSDVPVMSLSSLDRVSAIRRLNVLFGTNNKVKVLPGGCVTDVIFEGMDELCESLEE